MNLLPPTLCGALLLGLMSLNLHAANAKNGQKLHDSNCMRCHDSAVYTRENRRVQSLPALGKQVRRCELTLDLRWFDKDRDDVTHYLNDTYYHF